MEIVILRHGKPKILHSKSMCARDHLSWLEAYALSRLCKSSTPAEKVISLANRCNVEVCSELPRSFDSAKKLGVESKVILKSSQLILPRLESDAHGVEVVGMFFFEDSHYVLGNGDPIGERLAVIAKEKSMLLMGCDKCCYERQIDKKLVEGAVIGCFPNLYEALSSNMPDQVITLY